MVFWIGILVGGLFVWLAVKMGFYETWILLFNILIAVYLGVFLGPVIAHIFPIMPKSPYNNVLCMIIPSAAGFLILHGISFTLFTGQFSVPFTKTFDTCAAGLLGFLTGFLVWAFLSLLICTTPISQHSFVSEIDFADSFRQTGAPYVGWWCDRINSIVTSQDSGVTSKQVIIELIQNAESKTQPKTTEQTEPNPPDT